jgi:hypothetical protein
MLNSAFLGYKAAVMPAMLRDDIRLAYAEIKPAGFNENPMQKIPIIICGKCSQRFLSATHKQTRNRTICSLGDDGKTRRTNRRAT